MQYTVNHSETELIFVEASKFAPLKKALPKIKQNVKHIIYWGDAKQSDIDEIKSQVIRFLSWIGINTATLSLYSFYTAFFNLACL